MASPCIASDSDIAGIGVRASVYAQTLLNLICSAAFIRDGDINPKERKVLDEVSRNLSITTFAILFTATIQASTTGLSLYHALIVLNLCWINTCSAIVHAVFHVISSWRGLTQEHEIFPSQLLAILMSGLSKTSLVDIWKAFVHDSGIAFDRIATVLAMMGCIGMGAFGLAVWSNISRFGNEQQRICTPQLFLPVFGRDISVISPSLRKGSLVVYAITVVPGEIFLFFASGSLMINSPAIYYQCVKFVIGKIVIGDGVTLDLSSAMHPISGVLFMTFLEIYFIISTELMISRTRAAGLVADGEEMWSFGQTLAMVLVVMPLFQTVRAIWKLWGSGVQTTQEVETQPDIEKAQAASTSVQEASSSVVKEVSKVEVVGV